MKTEKTQIKTTKKKELKKTTLKKLKKNSLKKLKVVEKEKKKIVKKLGRLKKPSHCPTKYDPTWMDDKVEELLAKGHSKTAVAAMFGVASVTFYNWEQKHPNFFSSVQRGMAKCQKWWEDKGRDQFLDGKFNNGIYALIMGNHFNYSQKNEVKSETTVNHTGKVKVKVKNESDPKKLADVLGILIESGVFQQIASEESTTKTD